MKHIEGMHVSLVEQAMLDSSGILTSANGCTAAYGLSDASVGLFLAIAAAGENGLPKGKLPKDLQENLSEALLPLEMQNLVEWERDKRGQLVILVLTWKGKDALDAARPKPKTSRSWASHRRAEMAPGGFTMDSPAAAQPGQGTGTVRRRAGFGDVDSTRGASPLGTGTAPARQQGRQAYAATDAFDADVGGVADFAVDTPIGFLEEGISKPVRRSFGSGDDDLLGSISLGPADTDAPRIAAPTPLPSTVLVDLPLADLFLADS
jgi:hypothetical protein